MTGGSETAAVVVAVTGDSGEAAAVAVGSGCGGRWAIVQGQQECWLGVDSGATGSVVHVAVAVDGAVVGSFRRLYPIGGGRRDKVSVSRPCCSGFPRGSAVLAISREGRSGGRDWVRGAG